MLIYFPALSRTPSLRGFCFNESLLSILFIFMFEDNEVFIINQLSIKTAGPVSFLIAPALKRCDESRAARYGKKKKIKMLLF